MHEKAWCVLVTRMRHGPRRLSCKYRRPMTVMRWSCGSNVIRESMSKRNHKRNG